MTKRKKKAPEDRATMQILKTFEDVAVMYLPEEKEYTVARRNLLRRINQLSSAQRKLTKLRKRLKKNPQEFTDAE